MDQPLLLLAIDGDIDNIHPALAHACQRDVDDALGAAAIHGRAEVCELLASRASRMGISNALIRAVQAPSARTVQTLAPKAQAADCAQALSFATSSASLSIASMLLGFCANVSNADALRAAARANRVEAMELLFAHGRAHEAIGPALALAARSGAKEAVECLLPRCQDRQHHEAALRGACEDGRFDIAISILARGHVEDQFALNCAARAREEKLDRAEIFQQCVLALHEAKALSAVAATAPSVKTTRL